MFFVRFVSRPSPGPPRKIRLSKLEGLGLLALVETEHILLLLFTVYVIGATVFVIAGNGRPQVTFAWMFAFYLLPGLGIVLYILFGRDWKAFSHRRRILKQDLGPAVQSILSPILDEQEELIRALETQSVSHQKLMMLIRRNSISALTVRNRVEILQGAKAFYSRMIDDIRAARSSVHLQYYIWRDDALTEELRHILAAKVAEGVEVRLLYDPIGSTSPIHWRCFQSLRAAGVQVAATSPIYELHTISYRNHRKITVVDGKIGYTGGMNLGQEHLSDRWRDTQIRIAGQGSALLQTVFLVDWYNAVRENLFLPQYFPKDAIEAEDGNIPVQILPSGPDSRWAAIRQLYALMIVSARREVLIQSPYFILDTSISEALKAAALSGVDVKIMIAVREPKNQIPIWAANTFAADVVSAGVKVYLYTRGFLHAKTITIDSEICSIGSANIDIRSFSINYELNAVLYNEQLACQLRETFYDDLDHCTEFTLADYMRRNPVLRFRDSVARLASPLL